MEEEEEEEGKWCMLMAHRFFAQNLALVCCPCLCFLFGVFPMSCQKRVA